MVDRTDAYELEIRHLKEIIALRDEALETALTLQAKEYERRLELLNGEAARLQEMQSTYVQKAVYDEQQKGVHTEIKAIQRLVNIGIGALLVIEILLRFVIIK